MATIYFLAAVLIVFLAIAIARLAYLWRRFQLVSVEIRPRVEVLRYQYSALSRLSADASPLPDGLLEKPTQSFLWSDLATLDDAVAQMTPVDQIRRSIWWWRLRYRQTVSAEIYAAYEASKVPDQSSADESTLRADLRSIIAAIHQTDMAVAAKSLAQTLTSYLLGASIYVIFALLILPTKGVHVEESVVVVFAGWTGGVLSSQQRLVGDRLGDLRRSNLVSQLFQSVLLAPVSGAVFSILLYLFFIAGILKGDPFPSMSYPPDTNRDFFALVNCTQPSSVVELSKLLLWSFIAGFAERFVPDNIDKLIGKANQSKSIASPKQ